MKKECVLATLLLLFTAVGASAALKISLVTISPGPVVFEAFGHSAILVENPDVSSSQATLYEYGVPDPRKVFASNDPMAAFDDLLSSRSQTRAMKWVSPLSPVTAGGGNKLMRYPTILRSRYLFRYDATRTVWIDELHLTDEQAKNFIGLIEKDIASGDYGYDTLKNNCATRLRDNLFDDSVLGAGSRAALDATANTSLQEMILDSLDEAARDSTSKKVTLLPFQLAYTRQGRQTTAMLQMVGIPTEFTTAREFYDGLDKADASLADYLPGDSLPGDFHKYFFDPVLDEKPITESRAMFLPKRLRADLLNTVNPETGKPLIDVAEEIVRTTADEHKPYVPPAPHLLPRGAMERRNRAVGH